MQLYKSLKSSLSFCKITTKKDEINIRCPFCGDSKRDPHKGHMYIRTCAPYKYFCQKCNSTGIVSSYLLNKLRVNNATLLSAIDKGYYEYQQSLSKRHGNQLRGFNSKALDFIPTEYGELESKKIEYVIDRLGITMDESELSKYKMILNFGDFFKKNEFDISNRFKTEADKKLAMDLQNYCVGFLSLDKSTINCRSLDPDKTGFRYKQFTIFPDNYESKKFYSFGTDVDLSLLCHDIIITEGVMDIIGIYNHIFDKDNTKIYIANNGKNFISSLDYLSRLSILNANINIYSDKDVPLTDYNFLMENCLSAKFNGVTLFYNNISKDFGVKKEDILLSKGFEL